MIKKLSIFIILLLFPVVAYASDFSLECGYGPYKEGDIINCNLKTRKSYVYEEVSGSIKSNELFECSDPVIGQGLEEVSSDNSSFKYKGQENTGVIVSFSCEVKTLEQETKTQIVIDDFNYKVNKRSTDEIIKSATFELKHKEVEIPQNNKNRDTSHRESLLSNLTAPELSFTFSSLVTEYTIEVLNDVDKINLTAIPAVEGANVSIEGNQELAVGLNIIDVNVTSADGLYQTIYSLYITRLNEGEDIYYPETDATLKTLKIKGKSIGFKEGTYDYNVHLYANESTLDIVAEANYKDAIVDIDKNEDLKNGDIITITVTSADGLYTKKYTIKIAKDKPKKDLTPYFFIAGVIIIIIGALVGFVISTKRSGDIIVNVSEKVLDEIPTKSNTEGVQPTEPVQQVQQEVNPPVVETPIQSTESSQIVDNNENTNNQF